MSVQSLFPRKVKDIFLSREKEQVKPAASVSVSLRIIFTDKVIQNLILDVFSFFHIIDQRRIIIISVQNHPVSHKAHQIGITAVHREEFSAAPILLDLVNSISVGIYKNSAVIRHPHTHQIVLRELHLHRNLRSVRLIDKKLRVKRIIVLLAFRTVSLFDSFFLRVIFFGLLVHIADHGNRSVPAYGIIHHVIFIFNHGCPPIAHIGFPGLPVILRSDKILVLISYDQLSVRQTVEAVIVGCKF